MSTADEILGRWRANAASAGVPLSDEDIERIESRGFLARVAAIDALLARLDADEVAPDYLHMLSVQTGGGGHA
jgi:hypothetical protein